MKPFIVAAALVISIAACGKETKTESPNANTPSAEKKEHEEKEGGKVIVIQTYSDSAGNRFSPNEIEAHKGDILRFTNVSGAHNVNFLPDSNPGKAGLPPAGDLLQVPGQTYDLKVTLAEGKYYFQCDPHAALGMKGHLKVED